MLEIGLKDENVVGWLRNLDRKPWSLEIPYCDAGGFKSMFPDLLIVCKDKQGFKLDILEPHDPSRNDNLAKAIGLAGFSKNTGICSIELS